MTCPAPVLCFEKRRLMQAFATAVSDYNRMQSFQVKAVLAGEDFPYEEEIAKAAENRDNAKYALLAHQESHGC
jgi:hypothetical protein